jgi:hypothetical protein
MERQNGMEVGGRKAQKLWWLGEFGTTSWTVGEKIKAGAYLEATEIVVRTANVP